MPDARRRALLAEIKRLDGSVRFVIPSSLRDDHGRPAGVGGKLLPRVASSGGRRGSTLAPHVSDCGPRCLISRRKFRPELDPLACSVLDRNGGGDLVSASRLLGRHCGRDLAQRHIRAGVSLPARLYADRAPTNQMGTVRIPSLVATDDDPLYTLRYRVEPSTRQHSPLVDPPQFGWLVAHVGHRAAFVDSLYPALPPLRHRRSHKSHPGLRLADSVAWSGVLRERGLLAVRLPHPYRPRRFSATNHSGLHPRDRGAIRPFETTHPGVYRQAFLQAQVRREKDARRLLRQVAR